jgi:antitoxin (DNA-binding transcriptional repressor) of toxin-antitoxin stability system
MTSATIFEAKTNLSELIEKAQNGEKVVITKGREKTPVAILTPIVVKKPRRIGFLKHLNLPPIPDSAFFDPLPEEELRFWEEGGPDDPLNWSRERIDKVNAEANKKAAQGK